MRFARSSSAHSSKTTLGRSGQSKARLLYEDPGAAAAATLRSGLLRSSALPARACRRSRRSGFGAMGRFDGTLIGAQFVGPRIRLRRRRSGRCSTGAPDRLQLRSPERLVVVAAPQILYQLLTHYADVPLGLFVGLGVAAAGAWSTRPDDERLAARLRGCLSGDGRPPEERGSDVRGRSRDRIAGRAGGRSWRRGLLQASTAVAVLAGILMPWHLYCAAYGLTSSDYDLKNVANVAYLREHCGPVSARSSTSSGTSWRRRPTGAISSQRSVSGSSPGSSGAVGVRRPSPTPGSCSPGAV